VSLPDVIESWIAFKSEHEIDPMRVRPHAYESGLYSTPEQQRAYLASAAGSSSRVSFRGFLIA
jgi:hypothetical protein